MPKLKPRREAPENLLRISPGTSVVIRFVFTHAAMEKSPDPSARVSLWGTVMHALRPSNWAVPGQAGDRIWRRQCNRAIAFTMIAIARAIVKITV